ncbi:hypothetical protein SAMN05444161_6284 [Rhizobiales bacterium GAS191]|jgi:hypothetical protein|nr:hypothetical protein SAMN05444161_6284 [Rhizobiales bacterium GAS191]
MSGSSLRRRPPNRGELSFSRLPHAGIRVVPTGRELCKMPAEGRRLTRWKAPRSAIREFHVTEINLDLAFATLNLVLLAFASMVLVRLFGQARELSRSTKLLTDLADKMSCVDRHAVGQVARLAREISSDIGKLRRLDPTESENRIRPAE